MFRIKIMLLTSFYIIVFTSCFPRNVDDCILNTFDGKIKLNGSLDEVKRVYPDLKPCLACSEDGKVLFLSENTRIVDSISKSGINPMKYFYFDSNDQLNKLVSMYVFSFYNDKMRIKTNELSLLKDELTYLEDFMASDKNEFLKSDNCVEFHFELDTSSVYPMLKSSVKRL